MLEGRGTTIMKREGIDRRERNRISREGKMSWTNNFNDNVVMGWNVNDNDDWWG